MTLRHPLTRRSSLVGITGVALATALILSGCSSPDSSAPDEAGDPVTETAEEQASPVNEEAEGTGGGLPAASVTLAGQAFSFDIGTCMMDTDDVLITGPGRYDDSGEPAYLDVDFVQMSTLDAHGRLRIDLGTDQPFDSSDTFLYVDVGDGNEYVVSFGGGVLDLDGEFFSHDGAPIGPGTVAVDCKW